MRLWGFRVLVGLCVSVCWAAGPLRKPLGVYVHVNVSTAIGSYPGKPPSQSVLHAYLQNLYAGLLADPAIAGITFGAHWDQTQPSSGTAASSFDWSYIDDVFTAAMAAHKTVQLIITPGVNSPAWLFAQLPSCDPLFTKGSAPANCGYVTFAGFPEQQRADTNTIPLGWNPVYQQAWAVFLTSLNARYGSNPALVAVAISGPICASDEMILPTTINTTAPQPSGLAPDDMWAALIKNAFPTNAAYQKSDQVFIDAWKQAIDSAESIFTGVTLFLGPDAGQDFPTYGLTSVTPHPDNTLFAVDCSSTVKAQLVSCEAKTEILSYFLTVTGPNVKATQVGGMTASSPMTPGNIGVPGVKILTSLTPAPAVPFVGGAEFDFPISQSTTIQQTGCPDGNSDCVGLTIEEAAYNVLTVFFNQTPAAAFYGGTVGTAPIQYVDVPLPDLQYAQATPCPATVSPFLGNTSLQDLYARANRDLLAMAGQTTSLPRSTCAKAAPTPTISLVANAEGEAHLIAPNTWVEIKGSNLSPVGDTRIWEGPDFINNQLPTQLDGVSVTINGKAAFVYYISPTQINVLTPPDALPAAPQVIVTNNGTPSASFTAQAQPISPSFFVFDNTHVAAVHLNGELVGAASLSVPGFPFSPAKPGEIIQIYANGFGPTSTPVVPGSLTQGGTLLPLPTVKIGGITATVQFAGLVFPGEYQFNVVIPPNASGGDQLIAATFNGATTQAGTTITIAGAMTSTPVTYYVSPSGNDAWSGALPAPNAANSDGPFATFERARAAVQALDKNGLTEISVQFRGGTYYLARTVVLTAADSGSANLKIIYQNYPGETPVFSGGVRVTNWTNTSGDIWQTTLPASTQYFENLFYDGARRLRPRLGGYLGAYYRYAASVYLNAPAPPAKAPDPNCPVYIDGSGWECFDRFQYNLSDPISSTWKNLAPLAGNPCGQPAGNPAIAGDIELVNFEQYSVSKLRVSCVDTTHQIVYLTGPTATEADHPLAHGFIPGHRYLVENVQDALTHPGQWFLDRSASAWRLTYLANAGENPNNDTVVAPQLTQLLVASGLAYVSFQGLTFENDNYTMPVKGYNGAADIIAAVSFQNSQRIRFDSNTVRQTAGTALEFISCVDQSSKNWCLSLSANAVNANNVVQNSALYDLAANGIRIGAAGQASDTNANVAQFNSVQNTVVEGYGRVYVGSHGISQGQGHDNLYTHNEVYDGYKGAIKICYCANSDSNPPFTNNNVVSFNHVYNLFQGIMNDAGALYFGVGTPSPPQSGTGNQMLNNKVHDVTDASIMDPDGYGGDGLYFDDFTGQSGAENNLVYRVSGHAVSFSGPRAGANQQSTVKNNIFAYARLSMLNAYNPYSFNSAPPSPLFFVATNNIFYFDRKSSSNPAFYVQGGCVWAGQEPFTAYQQWNSNLYWRTDGTFATDANAFHFQQQQDAMNNCGGQTLWNFLSLGGWQKLNEDLTSVVGNPGFRNPTYPADDYSLPKGSPGVGFVVFDPTQAGRSNPVLLPPQVPATFPTMVYNPATDY